MPFSVLRLQLEFSPSSACSANPLSVRPAPTLWLCETILHQPISKPNLIRFRIDRSNYARLGVTLSQDVRMPVFFCTGNIFDFHDDDDHVRFVSHTKLA